MNVEEFRKYYEKNRARIEEEARWHRDFERKEDDEYYRILGEEIEQHPIYNLMRRPRIRARIGD